MKSNIILNSPDRKLLGVQIRQETATGFLNLSDLQDAYDSVRVQKGWSAKRIDHVTQTNHFKERCYYIIKKQSDTTPSFKGFMDACETEGIAKTLKESGMWKTTGRADNKATWCNPYIWVMIAMEMNPEVYAEVVVWVTDKLILNRIEAGDFYVKLTSHLSNWQEPNYSKIAMAINKVVFGRHENGMRQSLSAKELKELADFEKILAILITDGFISDEQALMTYLQDKLTKRLTK